MLTNPRSTSTKSDKIGDFLHEESGEIRRTARDTSVRQNDRVHVLTGDEA